MNNLSGFFEQAKKNLYTENDDYPQHHLEKQWLEKVRVVAARQPLLPPEIKDGVFDVVSDALYSNHWLELKYKKLDGTVSHPTVMPLGLAQQGERLYLVCRYQGYGSNLYETRLSKEQIIDDHGDHLTITAAVINSEP